MSHLIYRLRRRQRRKERPARNWVTDEQHEINARGDGAQVWAYKGWDYCFLNGECRPMPSEEQLGHKFNDHFQYRTRSFRLRHHAGWRALSSLIICIAVFLGCAIFGNPTNGEAVVMFVLLVSGVVFAIAYMAYSQRTL